MGPNESNWKVGLIQLAFVIAVISLAMFGSAALKPSANAGRDGPPVAATAAPISVSVATPAPQSYSPKIRLNGVVQSQAQINVTAQVGGRVIRVGETFRAGADLQRGDVLFQIDPVDFQLAVEQADVNVAAAASDLALLEAEARLARQEWEELFPGQPISELAARGPQVAAAKARLEGAKASKKTAELALRRTRVTASEPARVLSTSLTVGQVVAPNQAIGQIYTQSSVEVSAPIATEQLELLMPVIGRTAKIAPTAASSEATTGTVARVDAALDPRTRLATLFIAPETSGALPIGRFVDVELSANRFDGALRIPSSALAGRNQIWIVSDDKLAPRNVTVLGEEGDDVYIAGLDIGQGVLVLPPPEAEAGQVVRVRAASPELTLGETNVTAQ